MNKRIQIEKLEPKAYIGMFKLEDYLNNCGLHRIHKHLIYIRASQMNGCAYCINMHTGEALKVGELQQRIFLLDAWRETEFFSEEEKLILQITEEITFIHQDGLREITYEKAINQFGEHYLAQIIMAVVTVNCWNRISISTPKPIVMQNSF